MLIYPCVFTILLTIKTPSPELKFPTPADIVSYIAARETPERCRCLPGKEVRAILRYGAIAGSHIFAYPSLERGMDQARGFIDEYERRDRSFPSGLVILAGQLTGGKGRFKRSWHAPDGGIWMTMVLVNNMVPEVSRLLPLAAGVACCETVRRFGVPAHVKWVNDVHVKGRKVAGILMETLHGSRSGEEYILIGAGLNVNNGDFPPELASLAVSMGDVRGTTFDLGLVVTDLLAKFSWNIGLLYYQEARFLAEGDWGEGGILERWKQLSDTAGRRVRFGYDVQQQPQYEAKALGLAEDGGLRLLLVDDVEVTEYGGEIVYLD
ncbi:MAG: biotin--[acetyl-CoA-carboxylase] ligase [Deltaproteobacteria bacterium]|nr:biotin--[acetyl-CoA-carboxylase] ligase [Deltaproteobacteria bacterium]